MSEVYFFARNKREKVDSVFPFLRLSLAPGSNMMLPELIEPEHLVSASCRWNKFSTGKGITSHKRDQTVFGIPKMNERGLHGKLVEGFPGVDTPAQCYEPDSTLGFGDFVRWVYFVSEESDKGILGIDFSLQERSNGGVATSLIQASLTIAACVRHGIPDEAETALLNHVMLEPNVRLEFRAKYGLVTAGNWIENHERLFALGGSNCPRCGYDSLSNSDVYCTRCGCHRQSLQNAS